MRRWITLLCCLPLALQAATVYRAFDSQGNAIFSDAPFPGAHPYALPGITVVPSLPAKADEAASEPLAAPQPAIKRTPLADPEPVVDTKSTARPEPRVESIPLPAPAQIAEPEPIEAPGPVVEPQTVDSPKAVKPEPTTDSGSGVEPQPEAEPEPVAGPKPGCGAETVVASEPVVESEPVAEPEPKVPPLLIISPEHDAVLFGRAPLDVELQLTPELAEGQGLFYALDDRPPMRVMAARFSIADLASGNHTLAVWVADSEGRRTGRRYTANFELIRSLQLNPPPPVAGEPGAVPQAPPPPMAPPAPTPGPLNPPSPEPQSP